MKTINIKLKGIHWRFFFSRTKGQTKQNKKHRIEIDESLKTLNLTILKQFRHKHSYYKTISHKITNTQQFVLKHYYYDMISLEILLGPLPITSETC